MKCRASREKIHSRDRNLWHISHEGGELEDAANAPFASTWQISKSPQEAPDREEQVQIGFEKGIPVGVNGMRLGPVSLVELLNEIGGRNAIGRVDIVENRFVGIKSRGCYETPGGTLLIAAHRELEALCCERDVMHFKQHIASEVRRADVLRPVVHSAARSARRLCRQHAAGSHGNGFVVSI